MALSESRSVRRTQMRKAGMAGLSWILRRLVRGYQPMWWPPLMSRFDPVIQAACSSTRKATA